jgi:hypothetical protein
MTATNCREEVTAMKCEHCGATGVAMETSIHGVMMRFATFACGSESSEKFVAGEWEQGGTIRGARCRKDCGEVDKPTEMPDMRSWKRRGG